MRKIIWLALALMVYLFVVPVHAQAPETQATTTSAANAESPIVEYRLPPDKLAKSEALYRTAVIMFGVSIVYGLAVLIAVLAGRVSAKYRDIAEKKTARRFVQALIFVPLIMLTIDVLSLPLSIYGQHLQQSYGLSVQSWGSWFWDWTKGELVGIVIAVPILWGLYAILRRSPTRWWFYGWLAALPVILLLILIEPIFIAPLFDKFESLEAKQPQLVVELEKVMHRGGLSIERSRMFEMEASDKVTTYNAYVTGIGASKRVVVWDNTSRDMTPTETMFVFGHEQGHYVLNHVWMKLCFLMVGLLVFLYLIYRTIGVVLEKFGPRWGIRDLGDWASLPVLLLLLTVFSTIAQPISSTFSRHLEHQADIYGLEVTHGLSSDSSQAAVHAFQKLGEKGLSYPNPNPFYVFWVFDHPALYERIEFAARYKPWDHGDATEYVK